MFYNILTYILNSLAHSSGKLLSNSYLNNLTKELVFYILAQTTLSALY